MFCLLSLNVSADSEFFEKFKSDYGLLDLDLLNNVGEEATVKNFVYQKDVATFTFEEGVIHLLRYVEGRPTTAIFIGKGNARIEIPSHLERQSLMSVTGDSVVNEDFELCFIRLADDFDLRLKEQFEVKEKELKWKNFTIIKQAQGEFFFKPIVQHLYDNYIQLLRSVYERNADGFFWIDFNRYIFTYDPNRPEEVEVAYEFQVNDYLATPAAVFQKTARGITDDERMSEVSYATTALAKHGDFEMGGADGEKIVNGRAEMKLLVNADSLRFLSTFLHYNLKLDSVYSGGQPVDYTRRKDFRFVGIVLPRYYQKGDTVDLTFWYKGFNYDYSLPWVEDPTPSQHTFAFTTRKGFNYIMPGMGPVTREEGMDHFDVTPDQPYNRFYFQPYATGHDTVGVLSEIGLTVNFLKAKHMTKREDCYIPDDTYRESVMNAFNFMTKRVGNPIGTFGLYVFPDNYVSMPGLVEVPQILCYSDRNIEPMGGLSIYTGLSVANQWFGSLAKPVSSRDFWIIPAAADFLSVMAIQHTTSENYFFNLVNRRDSLYTLHDNDEDRPLGAGDRYSMTLQSNRGVWLFHMLRFLMYDIENRSEKSFNKFLYELTMTCNTTRFANGDLIKLAEKHYGEPLDWFFKQWLFDYRYPQYKVEYKIEDRGGQFYINATVVTEEVDPSFKMPVIMRVKDKNDQSTFLRETIAGVEHSFELGPFETEPKELIFNEFYSVLSKDKVKKK